MERITDDYSITKLSALNMHLKELDNINMDEVKSVFTKLAPDIEIIANTDVMNNVLIRISEDISVKEFIIRYEHIFNYIIMSNSTLTEMRIDDISFYFEIFKYTNSTFKVRLKNPM